MLVLQKISVFQTSFQDTGTHYTSEHMLLSYQPTPKGNSYPKHIAFYIHVYQHSFESNIEEKVGNYTATFELSGLYKEVLGYRVQNCLPYKVFRGA